MVKHLRMDVINSIIETMQTKYIAFQVQVGQTRIGYVPTTEMVVHGR